MLLCWCNGKSPAQHVKPELWISFHEERPWNGFAVISIAPCPDWELLKAPPNLEGALKAALQQRGSWQDLAPGSCPLSAHGLKNPFAIRGGQIMGTRKGWQRRLLSSLKSCSLDLCFHVPQSHIWHMDSKPMHCVFSLLFLKRQVKLSFNFLSAALCKQSTFLLEVQKTCLLWRVDGNLFHWFKQVSVWGQEEMAASLVQGQEGGMCPLRTSLASKHLLLL